MDALLDDDSSDSSDFEEDNRLPKRYIRDGLNPLEFYREKEFKQRYRFTKDAVVHGILPHINNSLTKNNNRGLPVAPIFQLLICLRFFATANFQVVCGDLLRYSQPTVSRIIFRVSILLARLMPDYIKMPRTREQELENRRLFGQIGAAVGPIGLPGIDGAIDCTHVRLTNTVFQQHGEVYRNRKGYFSLNVQAVVGPRMEFLDLVPEWPGSEHDSRIFRNSRIYIKYTSGTLTGTLVGDSGYPCLPFLLTPVRRPQTNAEEQYNLVQSRTRRIVERTFGTWKRRFPCLSKGLGNKLLCSTTIVTACAVLHNISLVIDNELPDDEIYDEEDEVPVDAPQWQPAEGLAIRQALIERLFNNNN